MVQPKSLILNIKLHVKMICFLPFIIFGVATVYLTYKMKEFSDQLQNINIKRIN